MKCPLCGHQFREEAAKAACQGCPLAGTCHNMVRCPNCGYDVPAEPRLVRAFRDWRKRNNGLRRKS